MQVRSSLLKASSMVPGSWGQSNDYCSWERVTCNCNDDDDDAVARVSALDLTSMYVYAPQEKSVVGVPENNNGCSWTLNLTVLSPLRELQMLDLSSSYACLQNLDDFQNLKNMRELHLRSNQLSGSIPASLLELPRLQYLDLSENLFQGHIPLSPSANISSSLWALKLSGNNLSGAFYFFWLRNCKMLEKIDLSGNNGLSIDVEFLGIVPPFQLRSLMLSGCNVDNNVIVGPNFLCTQRHLQMLDLSHNNFTGNIPNWIFANMATLVYLDIADNSLV
ncbi:hypothetical protein U9M48_044895 [Paspalum notatum var. saurae]|uniref:Leucine-rich repeat-containing N-terminal plant-type domain-containing protein n=1 Tax=Paspalum notatum var. saurae TaxID=547442 RepID=A0AAQ3XHY6_PASNO